MRYLLPLTLATIAALSATGCAGPNLQGYTIVRASDPSARDISCRLLADPRNTVRSFCVSAARWEQYDKWAATAGVTCREIPGPGKRQTREACLTAGQWRRVNYGDRLAVVGSGRNAGNLGQAEVLPSNQSEYQQPYATSYGPFPSGGAIGQSFQ